MCGLNSAIPLPSFAGMAELADALDLGSSISDVQVQVLLPVPYRVFITKLSFVRTLDTFLSLSFLNIVLFVSRFSALFSFYPAIAS